MEALPAMGDDRSARAMAVAAALCAALAATASAQEPGAAVDAASLPSAGTPVAGTPAPGAANDAAETAAPTAPAGAVSATYGEPGMGLSAVLEVGAYYTSAGLYVPIVRGPVPHVGERDEAGLYAALLPRSVLPRFVVLEASVNPMPCLGLLVRDQAEDLYRLGQFGEGVNLVRAATAGFEEPWAASVFVGNLAYYGVPGRPDMRGMGYFGIVVSGGTTHIKDNVAVDDGWMEIEVKLKGDRRSAVKKLSWSFRAGAKLHRNEDVVDAAFLAVRRSRVDYADPPGLLANSGFEYRFDASLQGRPLRHRFLVDKKWPLGPRLTASLAVGVMWEAGRAYEGELAGATREQVQLLVRPNVEF